MKTDAKTKREGAIALSNIGISLLTETDIRLALIKVGQGAVRDISALKEICSLNGAPEEALINAVVSSDYPLSLSALAVGGEDMKAIGFFGKEIGDTLATLLLMTARDEVKNEREALLCAAEKIKNGI